MDAVRRGPLDVGRMRRESLTQCCAAAAAAVTTGPVMAEAMFQNREEVPVIPIYRDPVHDFGFFAYDPAAVKFMEVTEIPLRPSEAVVGTDIRVCGVRDLC